MSFPRYPKYKASGVDWLGDVPDGWGVGRSRRLFALRNERARKDDKQLTASQKHGVIYQDDFIRLEGRRVVEVLTGADILRHVEPNDFVISMRSFQGGIEWCKVRGCISSAYVMLVPCNRIHGPFFAYLLKSTGYIQSLQTTSNLVRDGQALRYENFAKVDLPVIPVAEQIAIAEFLDQETGKINGLIAEQRRLVELLKEKRYAVISHAVTKGLNPHATMKPSGIEWLGDVPAGWVVKPLRYVCYCLDGSRIPLNGSQRAEKQGTIPYWGANSIVDYVDEDLFDEDLVLLGEDGAPFFDKSKPIAFFSRGKVWPNNHVHVLRPAFADTGKFIAYALNVTDYANFIDGSTRDKLTQGAMKEIPVPFPPLSEQTAITEFLDTELTKFDTLTAEAQRAIDLLQERRTALISAAVTGQIDVR